jgi:uroporphyrin-III C-methyltransferase
LVQTGKVYWVGAGPGHPELLTLKAAALLKGADVIIVMPRSPFTTPRIWIG